MKVRISTISPDGLAIKDTLPLEALNARMNEGRNNDVVFVQAPEVDVVLYKTGASAQLKGCVRTKFKQPCSLCNDTLELPMEISLDMVFASKPENNDRLADEKSEDFEEGVGFYYYEGDHVELEEHIQEAIILQLTPYWHPEIDEQGCCGYCHKQVRNNSKEEKAPTIKLGDLLQKASAKQSPKK